ncbi:hypothetical protein QQ008_07635 [Fulvivirgaceae bacterium BMA10]|uniref:TonB C-terminal domain-containing protein n=1 Tax=Splendidivirga corallicola TaxID=3051826 RepID=A0ABT8KMH1_9BACT|nr:hypothetical protein [Fulvivirgaceae bacterium BMA10]
MKQWMIIFLLAAFLLGCNRAYYKRKSYYKWFETSQFDNLWDERGSPIGSADFRYATPKLKPRNVMLYISKHFDKQPIGKKGAFICAIDSLSVVGNTVESRPKYSDFTNEERKIIIKALNKLKWKPEIANGRLRHSKVQVYLKFD